ncbi:hypothetical protein ACHWQZ_G004467 [Mnemiopsis leidyi]
MDSVRMLLGRARRFFSSFVPVNVVPHHDFYDDLNEIDEFENLLSEPDLNIDSTQEQIMEGSTQIGGGIDNDNDKKTEISRIRASDFIHPVNAPAWSLYPALLKKLKEMDSTTLLQMRSSALTQLEKIEIKNATSKKREPEKNDIEGDITKTISVMSVDEIVEEDLKKREKAYKAACLRAAFISLGQAKEVFSWGPTTGGFVIFHS